LATGRGSCLRALHAALKWCGVIYLLSRPTAMTWLRRAFAGGFAALGARLAFAER
jgi:threonine/homoserine/homoserine lactone efflux protein